MIKFFGRFLVSKEILEKEKEIAYSKGYTKALFLIREIVTGIKTGKIYMEPVTITGPIVLTDSIFIGKPDDGANSGLMTIKYDEKTN